MNDEIEYYVIPDIHGMGSLLEKTLKVIYNEQPEGGKIIFLGDYIDRGTENVKVLDIVMNPPENWEFITLKGNHESMLVEEHVYDGHAVLELMNSGRIYEFIDWMRELPIFHKEGKYVFAHAFYDTDLESSAQEENEVVWRRMSDSENWDPNYTGQVLIHGHTPKVNGPLTAINRINMDVGAFHTEKMLIARKMKEGYAETYGFKFEFVNE